MKVRFLKNMRCAFVTGRLFLHDIMMFGFETNSVVCAWEGVTGYVCRVCTHMHQVCVSVGGGGVGWGGGGGCVCVCVGCVCVCVCVCVCRVCVCV